MALTAPAIPDEAMGVGVGAVFHRQSTGVFRAGAVSPFPVAGQESMASFTLATWVGVTPAADWAGVLAREPLRASYGHHEPLPRRPLETSGHAKHTVPANTPTVLP